MEVSKERNGHVLLEEIVVMDIVVGTHHLILPPSCSFHYSQSREVKIHILYFFITAMEPSQKLKNMSTLQNWNLSPRYMPKEMR